MNLLTEDEAKQKWCPFVRVARYELPPQAEGEFVVGGTNRDALGKTRNPASCRCLASECMAWRKAMPAPHRNNEKPEFEYGKKGYCGLAGTPEEYRR